MIELHTGDPTDHALDPVTLGRGADLIDRHVAAGHSPTIAAVVTRHGEIVFEHCAGVARPGGEPVSADSLFPLMSNSKPMVSVVLLMLAEEGLVGLTSRAVDHLPELALGGNLDMTVANLLTHTAGWDTAGIERVRSARVEARDFGDVPAGMNFLTHVMLNLHWDLPALRPPNEVMEYETWNYSLLAEIIRRVTGQSLHDVMTERLFTPLGMTHTAVVANNALAPLVTRRAPGLPLTAEDDGTGIDINGELFLTSDDGGMAVLSSARDTARFHQFILDGAVVDGEHLLSPAAMRRLTTNQVPNIPAQLFEFTAPEASWSYGFGVGQHTPWHKFGGATTSLGTLRHGGQGGIYTWIDLEFGIGGVYFEVVTEVDEFGVPPLWAANRFEEIVSASILD